MYGHLLGIIQSFLLERFRQETCREIWKKSGCPLEVNSRSEYDEDVLERLITVATKTLGFPRDSLLTMIGEHYLVHLQKQGHDDLLRMLSETYEDFLQNLDYIHTYMMSQYPDINMPSFRCEASSGGIIRLHYFSFRKGLHPLVIGILKAAAAQYFKSEIEVKVVYNKMEDMGEGGVDRNHVIFSIVVTKATDNEEGPPTFVAQTRKNGEQQILKQDVERAVARLAEIRGRGDDVLPLDRQRVVAAKWRSIARLGILSNGFNPSYPAKLSVDTKAFCDAFPFHIVFNTEMNILHSGTKLQKMMPSIRTSSANLADMFNLLHPHSVTLTFNHIQKFTNTPFVLMSKGDKMVDTWVKKPMLILRGQMLSMPDNGVVIYLASPYVRSLHDLEQRSMYIADIPLHDVTRDLLWMDHMTRNYSQLDNSDHLGSEPTSSLCLVLPHSSPLRSLDPNDPEVLRTQLERTKAALAAEQERNLTLHSALLPRATATQILNGIKPQTEVYKNVTVLFSDIVSFTSIITQCKPNDVTNLLTHLYGVFNNICQTHKVFRVESIGDAYMVICGAPVAVDSHAQEVANTALGMLQAAREVTSPQPHGQHNTHIKIRVGIHTGSVTCGVVGDVIPRYLVMGHTVTMASRLESHGSEGKAHISHSTYKLLNKKRYSIEKRGDVIIRGLGKMTTYYLLPSDVTDHVTTPRDPQHVTFINDGHTEVPPLSGASGSRSPLVTPNRVTPLQAEQAGYSSATRGQ